jgi:hypothetical protein
VDLLVDHHQEVSYTKKSIHVKEETKAKILEDSTIHNHAKLPPASGMLNQKDNANDSCSVNNIHNGVADAAELTICKNIKDGLSIIQDLPQLLHLEAQELPCSERWRKDSVSTQEVETKTVVSKSSIALTSTLKPEDKNA